MNRDRLGGASGRCALFGAAKVERTFQAEAAQHVDIGLGQMAEMVGTEYLPPANSAAILAGIAAQIAEIAGAGEIEMTGRRFLHGVRISQALRQLNDWRVYWTAFGRSADMKKGRNAVSTRFPLLMSHQCPHRQHAWDGHQLSRTGLESSMAAS